MAETAPMDSKALLKRIRERWPKMRDADDHNRKMASEDMEFLYVNARQWDDAETRDRGDRPKYVFNELKGKCKRIINEMRANRPQGKVRAVEDGDTETAEVFEGLLRNIWSQSKGDHVTDYAASYQVGAGMGAWRVTTDYSSDTTFDQDITVKPLMNPFCLWWDNAAKDQLKRDAEDWWLSERISKASFERRWPNREVISLEEDNTHDEQDDWEKDDQVRIGEYWWKQPAVKTLYLLQSGKTVDEKPTGPVKDPVVNQREVKCHEIWMCIVGGGNAILEPPTKWAGKHFPFIVVFGEYIIIDGKVHWYGLVRDGKDPQQALNHAMTSVVENVESALDNQYWATAEQAKGNQTQWSEAHKEKIPVLIYNHDPKEPGPPTRMGSADVPVAHINIAGMMSDKLKSCTGVFDAALGQQSNETSGRAITARQNQGEIANFHFPDNMALGIEYTWEILGDLAPKIFDAARSIRILGADLSEKYVRINDVKPGPNGKATKVNDLTNFKFDLNVTVGPSWSTRRQEAVEMYGQLGQANPQLWQVAGDLLFKAMDLPYAEEISERMKTLLPPAIQQSLQEDSDVSPEVRMAMQQAEAAMAQVQQQAQMVQEAAMEAEKKTTQAQKAEMGVQGKLNEMEVARAKFEADVARQMAQIAGQQAALKVLEARLDAKTSQLELQQKQDELTVESGTAVTNIQRMAQEFGDAANEILTAMDLKEQQLSSQIDQLVTSEISDLMQQPAEPAGSELGVTQ